MAHRYGGSGGACFVRELIFSYVHTLLMPTLLPHVTSAYLGKNGSLVLGPSI